MKALQSKAQSHNTLYHSCGVGHKDVILVVVLFVCFVEPKLHTHTHKGNNNKPTTKEGKNNQLRSITNKNTKRGRERNRKNNNYKHAEREKSIETTTRIGTNADAKIVCQIEKQQEEE